ncbi:cytochrome P450 9e2-like [Atheta coriaria]|uniref:cytochrome P450 9e2-like n=1 Tax=Dalotia coriaria TaxID=877792 RepID=UPI0031F3EA5B
MFWVMVLVLSALYFYYFLYKPQLYWSKKNVKQGPPVPIFGDNLRLLFKRESFRDMVIRVYSRFQNARYCGLYQTTLPTLMIRDPNLIKQLTVKDFDHFVDHRALTPQHVDPLWGYNLFALTGDDWKQMRATLSPTFTSSKMRSMFLLMEKSAKQFVDFYLNKNQKVIDVELKESFSRIANDVIANCAFGLTVDSLKDPNNDFYVNGTDATNFNGLYKNLVVWLNTISPKITSALNLRVFSKQSTDFFKKIADDTIKYREEKNIIRPDVVHLLMEARKGRLRYDESSKTQDAGFATVEESDYGKIQSTKKMEFTDVEVAAQMFVFFFGGFDTISTMMSFTCYELALNPEIQAKLRQEIDDVYEKNKGELSYDILNGMKYLDMTISESLRMHPPAVFIDRLCTKEYTIKPEHPDEHPVHIKPGDNIWIPMVALHYDEKHYQNPNKFDPERFSDENKDLIKPYTYLPFGSGPRNCIGSRFALMEVKTLVFHILRNFELTVIDKSTVPLKLVKGTISSVVEGGFWIGMKKRTI